MFKNTYQSGFLSILYSIGSKPLQIWDKKVRNGHIKRLTDSDIQSSVLEIMGTNVSTTYITCPSDPAKTLGIKLPFLVMIIKNLKKYFTFEVTVLDDKEVRRRFRASNYQSTTRVKPFICTMPMRLDEGTQILTFGPARSRRGHPVGGTVPSLLQHGIRFSSTCRISPAARMGRTTSRLCVCSSMPTAASGESTSAIGSIARRSCLRSSSSSSQWPRRHKARHRLRPRPLQLDNEEPGVSLPASMSHPIGAHWSPRWPKQQNAKAPR
ncbi:Cilia- and flagella-associated protein 20 (Gene trap locus 3 protein) [Durusdinium trenchii]|uniref:Cilia- and flagella-associated protein 20 (Gene trap locus 3 protein) n=1 Tax=Durusdinium trenchii TaxID=1381693 RepID=A0ABP0Q528_9DINO